MEKTDDHFKIFSKLHYPSLTQSLRKVNVACKIKCAKKRIEYEQSSKLHQNIENIGWNRSVG